MHVTPEALVCNLQTNNAGTRSREKRTNNECVFTDISLRSHQEPRNTPEPEARQGLPHF